jgi:NADPH:quinone reductase-like Zn-dependent oxidoreductase
VCALLNGGGYAEKVAVPAAQVLPIPPGVSLEDAASLPEVDCLYDQSAICGRNILGNH